MGWRVFLGKVLELLFVLYHPHFPVLCFYVSRHLHSAILHALMTFFFLY
jgi:hypothetical protein